MGGLWSGEISPIGLSVAALCSQCDLMGLDILLLYYSTLPPLNIYRPNIGGVEDCWTDCPQHWLLDYHPPLNLVRLKEEDIDLAGLGIMLWSRRTILMVAGRNNMSTLHQSSSNPPRPAKFSHFCFRSLTSSSFGQLQIFTLELPCSSHPKGGPFDDRVVAFPGLFIYHLYNQKLQNDFW